MSGARLEAPTKPVLTCAIAEAAIAASIARARYMEMTVAVAIVDDGGRLFAFRRMDGCPWGSGEVALRKAISAAAYSRDTIVFDDRLTGGRNAVLGQPFAFPIQGGRALRIGEHCVGAIGISGGLAAKDTELCDAAVDVVAGAETRHG